MVGPRPYEEPPSEPPPPKGVWEPPIGVLAEPQELPESELSAGAAGVADFLGADLRAGDFARRPDFFATLFVAVLFFAPARRFLRAGAAFLAFIAFAFDFAFFAFFAFFAMIGSRSVAGQV